MDPIQITSEKRDEFTAELEHLKTTERAAILERLTVARAHGDLSENAEYHAAREIQGKNEARIKYLTEVLKRAEIVKKSSDGVVGLASAITIKRDGGEPLEYTIVGPAEADISAGKLSSESPIGAAVMGKKAGDTAEVRTPGGVAVWHVINVA